MTVFDEHLSGCEYSDMEFEEFLEWIVRVTYCTPDADAEAEVSFKLKLLARVK
jgi:hypothetical protein